MLISHKPSLPLSISYERSVEANVDLGFAPVSGLLDGIEGWRRIDDSEDDPSGEQRARDIGRPFCHRERHGRTLLHVGFFVEVLYGQWFGRHVARG